MDIQLLLNPELKPRSRQTSHLPQLIVSEKLRVQSQLKSPGLIKNESYAISPTRHLQAYSESKMAPQRFFLSRRVSDYLKTYFSKNKFPDTQERNQLAATLQVPAKSIQSLCL